MLCQSLNLFVELNVDRHVDLPQTYLGFKAAERPRMVEDILKRINISQRAKHFPQQLSGGQQQRVAIARAVVANPKLILADEPTGNLDSKNGKEVMGLLSELNKEGTHRNRNKGKDGKFMANLIPSHNHQRDIDGIKGQGNGNRKANKALAQNR